MDILGTRAVGSLSRVAANETKKGYFPTQEPDVTWICEALDVSCWSLRGKHGAVSVLDPCAGEGRFLSAVKRRLHDAIRDDNRNADIEVLTFAVELDGERFSSIRGTRQKVCGSFFDADASGQFDLVLLNPPYQRSSGGGGELVEWLRRSARMTSWRGLIVLIVPDREWQRREMQEYVKQNLRYVAAYRSARYATWNQVVVFLGQEGFGVSYGSTPKTDPVAEVSHTWEEAHAASGGHYRRLSLTPHTEAPPLLVSRDLSELYGRLRTLVETKGTQMLRQTYPTEYDTDCRPAMSLRTAHAVQIAAMRSTVEPVSINGRPYLGRYLIRQVAETFDNPDDGSTVTISKPTIEPVLLAADGSRLSLAETPWDPYALNRELSAALLRRISAVTPPLHEVGTDPDFLRDALEPLGLFPPQREVVKAIAKVYASGERGAICRASTGTGKTYTWRRRRRNQHGNLVLGAATAGDGSFSRYRLDACCKPAYGWNQYDTSQDAWYFGVWVNPLRREVLTYAEGDLTLVVCTDALSFNAEIALMNRFYGEGFLFKTIDDDGLTVYRQDRSTFYIPLLPAPSHPTN